jgi:hypothetical protein
MRRFSVIALVVCVGWVLLTARPAAAQLLVPPSLTAAVGYSNLQTQKATDLFYNHNGTYLDVDAAWSLPLLPLDLGIALTGSDYYERESSSLPSNSGYYPYDRMRSNLSLFEIEPRLGLHLGGSTGLYIEPRIGAGLLINSYGIDQATTNNDGTTSLDTQYHTGAAFEVRPAIQIGYSWPFISAGVEASYMYATGDFGGLGHSAREGRIGGFIKFTF